MSVFPRTWTAVVPVIQYTPSIQSDHDVAHAQVTVEEMVTTIHNKECYQRPNEMSYALEENRKLTI